MRSIVRTLWALLLLTAWPATAAAEKNLVEVRSRSDVAKVFAPASRIRIVNFWATWCIPCVVEMPDLQKVADDFKSDVEIVGVSFDDAVPGNREEQQARVRRFLESRDIRFKIAYYIGKVHKLAEEYEFDGEIPLTIVFDGAGRELMRHQGVIDRAKFTTQIKELLRTNAPGARKETS